MRDCCSPQEDAVAEPPQHTAQHRRLQSVKIKRAGSSGTLPPPHHSVTCHTCSAPLSPYAAHFAKSVARKPRRAPRLREACMNALGLIAARARPLESPPFPFVVPIEFLEGRQRGRKVRRGHSMGAERKAKNAKPTAARRWADSWLVKPRPLVPGTPGAKAHRACGMNR